MKKNYLFVLLLFIVQLLSGQNEPPVLPIIAPSQPEAAELGRYGDIPVSKHTGVPSISIPLYTINSGDINIPIALSYYAGGIRVNQEATWVGLGWSLSGVSNVITRTVKGKIDGFADSNKEKFDVWNDQTFNAYGGFLLNVIEGPVDLVPFVAGASGIDFDRDDMWVDGVQITDYSRISDMIRNQTSFYDWEPDLYTFNFLGYSGSFVFDKEGDIQLLSKDARLTFNRLPGNGTNVGWEVKTPNGLKIEFSESVIHTSYSEGNSDYNNVTDWFISKISSPTGEEILFNYSKAAQISTNQYSETFDLPYGKTPTPGYNRTPSGSYYTPTYLDSINFDEGTVLFEKSNRDDLDGGKKLDKIKVISNAGLQIKEFQFITDYLVSSSADDRHHFVKLGIVNTTTEDINKETKRLRLNSIVEKAGGESKTHLFDYNTTLLPRKSSFATDFWGFYNGETSNTSFISDYKGPVINQIVHGSSIGTSVTHFTSFLQSLDLNYPNISAGNRKPNVNTTKAGILEKIIYPTGGYTSFEYELHNYSNTELEYNLEQHEVVFDNFLNPQNPTENESVTVIIPSNVEVEDVTLNINAVKFIPSNTPPYEALPFSNDDYISINGSIIRLIDIVDVSPFNQINNHTVNISVEPNDIVTLQIHKSSNFFGLINAQFKYYISEAPLMNSAGGLRIKKITNDDRNGNLETTNYKYGPNENQSYGILKVPNRFYNTMYHDEFIDESQGGNEDVHNYQSHYTRFYGIATSSLFYGQSNHVGYSKVIETKGLNNENGYSEYYYYNSPNSTYEYADRPVWLPSYSRKFDGKLQLEKHYSATGKLLKSTDYKYDLTNVDLIKSFYRGFVPHQLYYNTVYSGGLHYYPILTKRESLVKKTDSIFDINGLNPITTVSNYFYDNDEHLQLTRSETTDSKGNLIKTKIFFPQDLTSPSSAEQKLIDQHQIATPIQTETTVSDSQGSLLSKATQHINFKDWGLNSNGTGNIILPEFVQTSKGSDPLEHRITYHNYDDKGNPLEVSKADGTYIIYIWGYNGEYPIAKIENITYSEISAYVPNLQTLSNSDDDRTIGTTGNEGALRSELNKLRDSNLYPALSNTMISTYTYDPLIGVTSITDPRGYTTYYEYDEFNRLKMVKDAEGNIVSKNEYNYKNN